MMSRLRSGLKKFTKQVYFKNYYKIILKMLKINKNKLQKFKN